MPCKNSTDILVSDTDGLSIDGEPIDRDRKLGEFKETNSPLSAAEIEHRKHEDWFENVEDLVPIPDRPPENSGQ